MSIIEKAVDKLEQNKPTSEAGTGASNREADDTLERVVSAGATEQAVVVPPKERAPAVSAPSPVADTAGTINGGSLGKAVESGLGAPVLKLPLAELSAQGIVTPLTPRSQIAEEFRIIKRPLLRNVDGTTATQVDHANLIMVTSALQGDGKTFTAINLAISIALEQDKTVLFVDADVAKASAGDMLAVPPESLGLIDVLENKGVSLRDAILQTNIEKLRILPAGNVHERSTELLASQGMQELMLDLASRYSDRVIVFDSPPLLLTTEASVLASFMGQIVFVVSTDQTPQQAITAALEHIGEDKIIGMVLNRAHRRRNNLLGLGYGYGYGSKSGYGYGYGYGEKGRSASPIKTSDAG